MFDNGSFLRRRKRFKRPTIHHQYHHHHPHQFQQQIDIAAHQAACTAYMLQHQRVINYQPVLSVL